MSTPCPVEPWSRVLSVICGTMISEGFYGMEKLSQFMGHSAWPRVYVLLHGTARCQQQGGLSAAF